MNRIVLLILTVLVIVGVIVAIIMNTNNNNSDSVTIIENDSLTAVKTQDGEGDKVVASGDEISIHYKGTLEDGTVFDSSYDRGTPLDITIGVGMVIKGWDEGVIGMKVNEKRTLTISPELAYGSRGVPPSIPGNATLIFEVELLEIK